MAVPKRKISKTRGRKRRTHWKAKENLSLEKCYSNWYQSIQRHKAYYVDGVLYYKGKIHQNNQ